jgi:hypothetical protein
MAQRLDSAKAAGDQPARIRSAILEATGRPNRGSAACRHTADARFRPGQPLQIEISIESGARLSSVRLYYRQVNQAERFQVAEMQLAESRYRAAIPGDYTNSPFPLQYYFELSAGPEKAWLYPGFAPNLANQPYYVVRPLLTKL